MPEAVTPPKSDDGSIRPVPDPTRLTIDALRREIAMLANTIDTKIDAAESLNQERITRIDTLMERAEEMRREQKADTRSAVEAALASQKEQTSALRTNLETTISSLHTAISDLKDRMTIVEAVKQGATEQKGERRQINAGVLSLIGVGIALLVAILAVLSFAATVD